MKDLLTSEEGSILPIFAVVITILFIIMAMAVDFGRQVLVSEKLKMATDSAANAAAFSAKRYVRVEIDPGRYEDLCCSEHKCRRCCKDCGEPFEVVGREDELIEQKGYKKYCCSCGCGGFAILERWVEYEDNGAEARTAAQAYFDMNRPKEMTSAAGGESYISSIEIYDNKSSNLYPSVVVRARGEIKTLMLNFMDKMYGSDLTHLDTSKCSQGGTFYYDVNNQKHRAAKSIEGCE